MSRSGSKPAGACLSLMGCSSRRMLLLLAISSMVGVSRCISLETTDTRRTGIHSLIVSGSFHPEVGGGERLSDGYRGSTDDASAYRVQSLRQCKGRAHHCRWE